MKRMLIIFGLTTLAALVLTCIVQAPKAEAVTFAWPRNSPPATGQSPFRLRSATSTATTSWM